MEVLISLIRARCILSPMDQIHRSQFLPFAAPWTHCHYNYSSVHENHGTSFLAWTRCVVFPLLEISPIVDHLRPLGEEVCVIWMSLVHVLRYNLYNLSFRVALS
jgi:hypothetical protein